MKDFLDDCDEYEFPKIDDDNEYLGISSLPNNPVTTMAYVPFQTDTSMYDIETGFRCGTVFKNLNKPFLGGRCK